MFSRALGSGSHLRATTAAASRLRPRADVGPVTHRATSVTGGDRLLIQSHRDDLIAAVDVTGHPLPLEGDHCDVGVTQFPHTEDIALLPPQLLLERARCIFGVNVDDSLADVARGFGVSAERKLAAPDHQHNVTKEPLGGGH